MSILVIDGVKYEAWTPTNEDEFVRMVEEHAKDIFGEQSIYLDIKHKLRTKSGIGSIPDGYVIVFGVQPDWYIVEVELSSHPLYDHIVPQVGKFISGIRNPSTQKEIVDALFHEIDTDELLRLRLRKAIGATETYKFLADLVSRPPVVTIIIEKRTEQLDEAIEALRHPQIKIVEFQTFTREGIGLDVHAHLFEPVTKSVALVPPQPEASRSLEHTLTRRELKKEFFRIPKRDKQFFPGPAIQFELQTDMGMVKTNGRGTKDPLFIQKNLRNWFRKHPELKPDISKVVFEVIEPMKRYRLKIA